MNMKQEMNSFSIVHFIILASILEPIPEKVGCTTRYKDWQEKSKLEYFLIAGVNIGNTFYELMERIKENNYEQPHVIYDLAYKAQKESLKNRKVEKLILVLSNYSFPSLLHNWFLERWILLFWIM